MAKQKHHTKQLKIPATYMRGGTSKGVFFHLEDLPKDAQVPGTFRDQLLLRVIGSPDPYGKHTDGMGGATSSTSKVVIISRSTRPGFDVDYLFGQVAIDKAVIDWSGNCGNLTAAVGAFAITNQLMAQNDLPKNGIATVRIWQVNIEKTIIAKVPIIDGEVQEIGDFELDGVAFPAAEVQVEFIDPAPKDGSMFPTGNVLDDLVVPELGTFSATLINAGIPTIFLNASDLNYQGTELQEAINNDEAALEKFEQIRVYGAVQMGLSATVQEASKHQHTPKIALVAEPQSYLSSSGKHIKSSDINVLVRALSMGKLHHAMMGTAAVAIGVAASVIGTIVHKAAGADEKPSIVFGHPSGTLKVGAEVYQDKGIWLARSVAMSRSARVLMEGFVRVPTKE